MEWYCARDKDVELWHHGILGQKWGIRRYQNYDGTLTPDGSRRYGSQREMISEIGDELKVFTQKQKRKNYRDYMAFVNKAVFLTPNNNSKSYESSKKKFNDLKENSDYVMALAKTKEYKDVLKCHEDTFNDYAKWNGDPELRQKAYDGFIKDAMKYSGKDKDYVEKNLVGDKDEDAYEWYRDNMREHTYHEEFNRYDTACDALNKRAIAMAKDYFGEDVSYPPVNGIYNTRPTIMANYAYADYLYNYDKPEERRWKE